MLTKVARSSAALGGVLVLALWAHVASAADGRARDLYLASRDEIRRVEKLVGEAPAMKGGTLVGIVGGLAVLNFIERLQPSEMMLIDLNPAQVEYGRCVIELIKQTPGRDAFVAAFFSRPFLDDEQAFLAQPGDEEMLRTNMQRIGDRSLRESCTNDLGLIARGTYDAATKSVIVTRNSNGKYVQRGGPDKGMPTAYNFLYYGRGWLASAESYDRTRAALRAAKTRFLASDIGAAPVQDIKGREIYFWGTNLATWFEGGKEGYERFVIRAHEEFASRDQAIRFAFASTYRRTAVTNFVPYKQLGDGVHLDASAKVRKHAEGKTVLELIPGRAYFGKELRAKESTVQNAAQPIDAALQFEVAVLHILNNSGMKWWQKDRGTEFKALYEQVLERGKEVVILEHNRASADFSETEKARMVGIGELLKPLFPILAKRRLSLDLELCVGKTDTARNLVLHVKKL